MAWVEKAKNVAKGALTNGGGRAKKPDYESNYDSDYDASGREQDDGLDGPFVDRPLGDDGGFAYGYGGKAPEKAPVTTDSDDFWQTNGGVTVQEPPASTGGPAFEVKKEEGVSVPQQEPYQPQYTQQEQETMLISSMEYADRFVNKGYMMDFGGANVVSPVEKELEVKAGLSAIEREKIQKFNVGVREREEAEEKKKVYRVIHVSRLMLDKDEDVNDKLVSVYGALHSIEATAFIIIRSDGRNADFYIGAKTTGVLAGSLAGNVLRSGMEGNFPGSKTHELEIGEIQRLLRDATRGYGVPDVATVTTIPAERDKDRNFVQGLEKLIDALKGKQYTAMFIAEPLTQQDIAVRKLGLEHLYSTISPFAKTSLAYGENYSHAVSDGLVKGLSESVSHSVSDSYSEGVSHTHTVGVTLTDTTGTTVTDGSSHTDGTSSNQSYGTSGSSSTPNDYGGSDSASSNESFSTGQSSSDTTSHSVSRSESHSESHSASDSYGTSSTWSHAVTEGTSSSTSTSTSLTNTDTSGNSRTLTITHDNKSVTNLMEQLDSQLKRIKDCEAFGLWNASAYFIADSQTVTVAASLYRSLITGDDSRLENSYVNFWRGSSGCQWMNEVLESLQRVRHPVLRLPAIGKGAETQDVKPATMVSGKELPLLLGFPRKSVSGLLVDNMASFGRNIYYSSERVIPDERKRIHLGSVMHKGVVDDKNPVDLDLELFRSHCFITGSTGSGKSNTTYQLLKEMYQKNIKFLVVEPAKGEYKIDLGRLPGLNVYWTNPREYPLLRVNPFRFPDGIHVLEHLDQLIDIFNTCWPLHAAMPSILKKAVQQAYVSVGWDLNKSIHFGTGRAKFPTFRDLERELVNVINSSSYSQESKGEYIGALVTRVQGLTSGIMGQVFCAETDISDEKLFDEYTVVDLSRAKSTETKSLIMGVLVMRLNEYRTATATETNQPLKHITVLEEAHNLLKRVSPGSGSEMQQKSVEMLSSSIAEMRTYGEGFLIVDQSPSAVDISAIKNTNTKIVMNLPLEEDFQVIGGSFALNEDQTQEISRLGNGMAIVKQSTWLEPIMTQVAYAGEAFKLSKNERVQADEKALNRMIGRLCEEILRQSEDGSWDVSRMKACLNDAPLNQMKREEYEEQLDQCDWPNLAAWNSDDMRMRQKARKTVSALLMKLMNCQGLFQLMPLQLPKKETATLQEERDIARQWRNRMLFMLDEYATFSTELAKARAFKRLVYFLAVSGGNQRQTYQRYINMNL